ncbi:hypothetical protein [Asticcacaulis sp. AC402]|uniref:helix-turn-helix transcriptional regulator n=1 Tax=Asticcacaulis sp. AC402 TaxID=1282361 RepID=UPI0003C3D6F6|nr:hypothetical protein [Asticcacaulis sp. AC402]ESQ74050.1 hypothetical protein ABAC402_16260 [Asticcacaulis sp. AC402]
MTATGVGHIVDSIYNAGLDEKALSTLARRLAEYAGAQTATLSLHTCDIRAFLGLRDCLLAEAEIDYADQFLTQDVWRQAAKYMDSIGRTGPWARDGAAFKEVYQRLYLPLGDDSTFSLNALIATEHGVMSVATQRPTVNAPFSAADASKLQTLVPHLRRMQITRHRVQFLEAQASFARNALDCYAYPTLVILNDRHIVLANAAARAFLSRKESLFEQDGKLFAPQAGDARKLAAAVIKAQQGHEAGEARAAEIFRLGTGAPEDVRLIMSAMTGGKTILVILDDPAAPRISGTNLAELYGLTAAETALAEALLRGETIDTFADSRNVRMTTVRSQLSSVMRKTDTERQSQLVALLSRLPALTLREHSETKVFAAS